jgi:hypothetical protein
MAMGKRTDPSLGRWISYEIVRRKRVELASYLRLNGRYAFIRTQNANIIKLSSLMIFNEGSQCFFSNRRFVQSHQAWKVVKM